MARWTRFKSRALIAFTQSLTERVRAIRGPQVQTARNIYAMPVLDPASEARFGQNRRISCRPTTGWRRWRCR